MKQAMRDRVDHLKRYSPEFLEEQATGVIKQQKRLAAELSAIRRAQKEIRRELAGSKAELRIG